MTMRIKTGLLLLCLFFALGCNVLQDLTEPSGSAATDAPSVTTLADPLIVRAVEFPAIVDTQGGAIDGWVYMYCQDCSAPQDWETFARVDFSVVEAGDFTSFGFDPRPWIENVGKSEIRFAFNIRCGTPQNVILQVKVIDTHGEQSNPYEFSFTCE